jgi:hypothetical protein
MGDLAATVEFAMPHIVKHQAEVPPPVIRLGDAVSHGRGGSNALSKVAPCPDL